MALNRKVRRIPLLFNEILVLPMLIMLLLSCNVSNEKLIGQYVPDSGNYGVSQRIIRIFPNNKIFDGVNFGSYQLVGDKINAHFRGYDSVFTVKAKDPIYIIPEKGPSGYSNLIGAWFSRTDPMIWTSYEEEFLEKCAFVLFSVDIERLNSTQMQALVDYVVAEKVKAKNNNKTLYEFENTVH